ncbi:MAG: nuclear transport factor 2 family protein [Chthoniobacter sp.]|uniref:nuclear transport factor 2 family protein n=1 Tax=Chthoniobacter sp. TaxID=2510640 RepID=UPI0032A521DD
MKSLFPLLVLLAVLTSGQIARADEAADKEELRAIEKRSTASLVSGDFQALGSIFAEEWMLVSPDGKVVSREAIFKQLTSGDLKFSSYELGEMEIRVFGDTAVVVGHGNPHGEYKGEKFEEDEVFSDTFIRVGGRWRCILSHSSEVDEAK